MLCERCKKRPATVHYTEIVNGRKREMHLCAVCAEEEGVGMNFKVTAPFKMDSLFADLLGAQMPHLSDGVEKGAACPRCGMTEQEFAGTGRFGCAECYQVFRPQLDPVLRRVQGNLRHTGKVPARAQSRVRRARDIERLRAELQQAVRREEFEQAAVLRDRIKEMEQRAEQDKGEE